MNIVKNLRLKTKLLIVFCLFLSFIFMALSSYTLVHAIEPTSTASSSSADFQAKLKALQEEIASKAAKLKTEISKKLQNKAFIGFIKSISQTTITIGTETGTRIINLNEYTEYKGKKGKAVVNLNNLEVDDYIAALGDIDETETLTAKKIILLEPPKENKKQIVFGKVILLTSPIVTLQTKDNQKITFQTSAKTVYQLGKKAGNFDNIELNKPLVAVITATADAWVARFIYIFPYSSNIEPEASASSKVSTPSASSRQIPQVTLTNMPKRN